jgi:hypothetical protein
MLLRMLAVLSRLVGGDRDDDFPMDPLLTEAI